MNNAQMQDIENFENIVATCYGKPEGDELPQVANMTDIVKTVTENIQ